MQVVPQSRKGYARGPRPRPGVRVAWLMRRIGETKPRAMQRILHTIAVTLLCASSLIAQVTPPPQPALVHDDCVLATTAEDWTAMGLTTAQVEEVQAVQTECKTACVALKETGREDPAMSQAMLEKHRERIRTVLTKEQYDKWVAWCSTRPSRG